MKKISANSILSLFVLIINLYLSHSQQQYSSISLGPVTIQWLNTGTQTNFVASLSTNSVNVYDSWLGIGINTLSQMVIFTN